MPCNSRNQPTFFNTAWQSMFRQVMWNEPLAVVLEDQQPKAKSTPSIFLKFLVVARINPWNDANCFGIVNDASRRPHESLSHVGLEAAPDWRSATSGWFVWILEFELRQVVMLCLSGIRTAYCREPMRFASRFFVAFPMSWPKITTPKSVRETAMP